MNEKLLRIPLLPASSMAHKCPLLASNLFLVWTDSGWGTLVITVFCFHLCKTSSSEMCKIAIKFAFMTFIFSFYKTKFTDNLRHHHPFSRSSTDYACYQFIKSLIPFPFLCVCFFHFPINIFPMRKNGHLIVIDMYDNDKE